MVLLAYGAAKDELWIPLILVISLLMVVLGQKLANFIFRRFFCKKESRVDTGIIGKPGNLL